MNFNFEPQSTFMKTKLRNKIKILVWVFVIGLVLSGLTAFPIETLFN